MPTSSLRERQAEQVRITVLEATLTELERKPLDDVSMADVAKTAGVSLRTLYRYFPDRASLLHAAGEHLYDSLGVPYAIDGPDEVSASFRAAARRLSSRPMLARVMVATTAGRAVRAATRSHRVDAIRAALQPLTDGLDPTMARHATAIITYLCGASSWVNITDESSLKDTDAQAAVAWAIDSLIDSLRAEQRRSRRTRRSDRIDLRRGHEFNNH